MMISLIESILVNLPNCFMNPEHFESADVEMNLSQLHTARVMNP